MEAVENDINSIKNNIINNSILGTFLFSYPALFLSLIRVIDTGWNWLFVTHIVIVLLVTVLFFYRKKLSLAFKTNSLCLLFYTLGVLGLIKYGISGGYYWGVIATVLLTLFYGKKTSKYFIYLYVLIFLFIGILFHLKIINCQVDFNIYNNNITTWISVISTYFFQTTIVIYSIGLFYNYFNNVIKSLNLKNKELEKINLEILKAKSNIEENEKKLIEAHDIARLGSWELDIETGIFTFTDNFYRIFHTDVQQIGGYQLPLQDYADRFLHPDDVSIVAEETKKALLTDDPNYSAYIEHRILYVTGEMGYIAVKMFIKKDLNGKTIKTYGVNQDITERKKAEEAIRESEAKLATIFKRAGALISISDVKTGIFTDINDYAVEFSGYTKEEMIGRSSLEIGWITPEVRNLLIYELQEKGRIDNLEISVRKKSGDIAFVLTSGEVILIGGKEQLLIISVDITERKQAEELLAEQNQLLEAQYEEYMQLNEELRATNYDLEIEKEKAEESDKLKTAFLQNMSHEIRTPLNGILGFSNLLQADDISKEEIKDFTDIIQSSGQRLMETVNNVLDISKIETGQMSIQNNSFFIDSLLKELYSFFLPSAKIKGLNLQYTNLMEETHCKLFSDETKVNQILLNLINNALKFTKTGQIDFGFEIKEQMVLFYVKDTGIGIPKEMQTSIFRRFTQADLSISRGYEGAGLGLSICEGLVELLGGKIWCESELDSGSSFYFTLPMIQHENVPISNNKVDFAQSDLKKIKILIAEDDHTCYLYIEKSFKRHNFELLRAQNGKEAVEICSSTDDLDLVLMDMKMPVMNGFEAVKLLKELKPTLPIIAQTAHGYSEERDRILSIGCDDYISKPIDFNKLIKLIDKYTT